MPRNYSTGLAAITTGDYDTAIKFFHRITVEDKDDFFGYYYLAGALFQTGQYQQAIDALGWAIFIDPKHAQARYNRALALEKLEQYNDALAGLRDAIALMPNYPEAQQAMLRLQSKLSPARPVPADVVLSEGSHNGPVANATQVYKISPSVKSAQAAPNIAIGHPGYTSAFGKNPLLTGTRLRNEEISLVGAFGKLREALLFPRQYMTDQSGYGGFMAPFWMYVALKLLGILFGTLGSMAGSGHVVATGAMGEFYGTVHNLVSSICSWTYPFFFASTIAMFGVVAAKRKDFSGYFRIAVISSIPVIACTAVLGILVPIVAPKPVINASAASGSQSSQLGEYTSTAQARQQYGATGNSYGMQQYAQGSSQYLPTSPSANSDGTSGQNAQIRAQLNNLQSQLGGMAASIKSIPPAPLWLVIPLLLVQLALLSWYCVLVVLGCRIILDTSVMGAAIVGAGSLILYLGSTVLIYNATNAFMKAVYGAVKSRSGVPPGLGQGGL